MMLQNLYVLFDPIEPEHFRYAGYTVHRVKQRLSEHLEEARSGRWNHTHKNRWVNKVLRQGRTPSVRWVGASSDPDQAERALIKRLKEEGHRLTNGTEGGKGCLGARWKLKPDQVKALRNRKLKPATPTTRRKRRDVAMGNQHWKGKDGTKLGFNAPEVRAKRKGRKLSAAHIVSLKIAWGRRKAAIPPKPPKEPKLPGMTGKHHSEETKRLWSKRRKGVKRSAVATQRAAESNRGRTRTLEQRIRISEGRKKAWDREKNVVQQ